MAHDQPPHYNAFPNPETYGGYWPQGPTGAGVHTQHAATHPDLHGVSWAGLNGDVTGTNQLQPGYGNSMPDPHNVGQSGHSGSSYEQNTHPFQLNHRASMPAVVQGGVPLVEGQPFGSTYNGSGQAPYGVMGGGGGRVQGSNRLALNVVCKVVHRDKSQSQGPNLVVLAYTHWSISELKTQIARKFVEHQCGKADKAQDGMALYTYATGSTLGAYVRNLDNFWGYGVMDGYVEDHFQNNDQVFATLNVLKMKPDERKGCCCTIS
eukprot:comp63391_c0_seq1/m.47949 comp63391_c0_seq1/g.47949  ORF comp63391_c0_seq1/g.47949 comp63391_c0_seq1/m.47949 type:complete len:264 (-) comp63391_c0_seq1:128-919(-)